MKLGAKIFGALAALMLITGIGANTALAQYDYSDYYYDDYSYSSEDEAMAGVFVILTICCYALVGIIVLVDIVIRIISLVHCIQNAPEDQKTLWIVLILLVPICNWIYLFTKKKIWVKGTGPVTPVS